MPESLLHELETAPAPVDELENTDTVLQQLPQIVQRVRGAMEHSRESVTVFQNTWRGLVAAVAEGRTAEVQPLRDTFVTAVEDRLRHLKHTHTRATLLRNLGMPGIPDPAALVPLITGLELMKSRVCDRWHTAEDLEDLAARDYALTTADLERIGPKCGPPASWYAEEGKPF